jgi:hypothetical protein
MRFMAIWTWEPEQRDPMYQKRTTEGRLLPEGIKPISEWLDVQGGRGFFLCECEDTMAIWSACNNWNNIAKWDVFPVVEVQDDKATKFA